MSEMLNYGFHEFVKTYESYIKLRKQFMEMKMEQSGRAQLITALDKIIKEHRKTVESLMDKMEEPMHTWTFKAEPETVQSSH
jgi:flagellar biosynthesis chaperone FliJ